MKNQTTAIVLAALMVFCLFAYFVFYVPHENQIAYQQSVECTGLVAQAEKSNEAKTQGSLRGFIFAEPKAHFNRRLNTCLGDFSANYSTNVNATTGELTITKSIVDVVSNAAIFTSVTNTFTSNGVSTTTLSGGISPDDFIVQENILMTE